MLDVVLINLNLTQTWQMLQKYLSTSFTDGLTRMFAHTKTTRKGTLNLQGGIFMFVKHSSHSALKHRCISAAECVLSEAVIQSGLEGFHRDSSVPVKRLHLVYRFLPIMPSHTTAECASNHRPHPLGSICSINSRNAKSKFQKNILQKRFICTPRKQKTFHQFKNLG